MKKSKLLFLFLISASALSAKISTWVGTAPEPLWSHPKNWDNGIPNGPEDVAVFEREYPFSSVNVDQPIELKSLVLTPMNQGVFKIEGNTLTIHSRIDTSGERMTEMRCPVVLKDTVTIESNHALQALLTFHGPIHGDHPLILDGAVVRLAGCENNLKGALILRNESSLLLDALCGPVIPGELIIDDDSMVTHLRPNQLAETAHIIIHEGEWDIATFAESIADLEIHGAHARVIGSENLKVITSEEPLAIAGTIETVQFDGDSNEEGDLYVANVEHTQTSIGEIDLGNSSRKFYTEPHTLATINGKIQSANPSSGWIKTGGGCAELSGSEENAYLGDTVVTQGLLRLCKQGGKKAILGDLIIQSDARVENGETSQLNHSSHVSMAKHASWNTNGSHEAISTLSLDSDAWIEGGGVFELHAEEGPTLSIKRNAKALSSFQINSDETQFISYLKDDLEDEESKSAFIEEVTFNGGTKEYQVAKEIAKEGFVELEVGKGRGANTSIRKTGEGSLRFTDSHDYSGCSFEVDEGVLRVDHALTIANLQIGEGAVLKGNGTIYGSMTLEGIFRPGASIGTMQLHGDQTFASSSITEIEVDSQSADLINILDGRLIIEEGATLKVFRIEEMNSPTQITYSVIRASDGIVGEFEIFTPNFLLFQITPEYIPGELLLHVNVETLATLPLSGNQKQVAHALEKLCDSSNLELKEVVQKVKLAQSMYQLENTLDQLSPSLIGAFATTQELSTFRIQSSIGTRMRAFQNPCCIIPISCLSGWLDFQGSFSRQNDTHDEYGFDTNGGSAMLGIDYHISDPLILGLGGAYSFQRISANGIDLEGDIHSGYGSLYGGLKCGCFFADLSLIGAGNWYSSTRQISFESIEETANGSFTGFTLLGHLDMGYQFGKTYLFTPFAQLDYVYLDQGSYSESGAGSLNLQLQSNDRNVLRFETGLFLDQCFPCCCGTFTIEEKLSYVREERLDGSRYTAEFENTNTPFTIAAYSPDRNLFSPALTLYYTLRSGKNTFWIKYEGEFGQHYNQQNVQLGFFF